MRTKLKHFIPILLIAGLVACTGNRKADEKTAPLYPPPQSVEVNTKGGYAVNPVTGDSIQAVVLESGDTLKTGKFVSIKGKVVHLDSTEQPQNIKAPPEDQLTTINAHTNVHKIPEDLTVIPVNKDSLTVIPLEDIAVDDTFHYHLNALGDTVKTGVPIMSKGKLVPTKQPKSIPAQLPIFKDAAVSNIQNLDVDQGLGSSYVMSVLEDKRGNIWFGTNGGGVCMYNGETFTQFTEEEGLSENIVFSILEDKRGNLWFGTDGGGVSMYDGEKFTHFTEKEGFSCNYVLPILEDQHGNLWFGTNGEGMCRYDGESFIHYTEREGLSNNFVLSILEDKSRNLWFGTDGGGVSMFNGKSFTHFTKKDGLSSNYVWSILEDQNGNIWFGTVGGGASMYNGESFTHFTEEEGLSNNIVRSILEDKNGNLWFGTYGKGVNKYNGETFTHFTEEEGLSNDYIFSIMEDQSGNLWFGTYGGGVSIYNGESFMNYTEKSGLSSNSIRSILEDQSGNLWFGTEGGGVNMYNGSSFKHFTQTDGISNDVVFSILEDKNGNLWFGTYGGGVSMYNGKSFTHYNTATGLSDKVVFDILEDQNGNLWFSTWRGGVCMYDGESFTHYTEKEGFSSDMVFNILEDKNGNIWFGTYEGGVSMYNGESFMHLTEKEGLSDNSVYAIAEDRNGNMWFGTNGGGVCLYNGESFTYFTEKEGLSNNSVQSIQEDQSGTIWVSTRNGLNQLTSIAGKDGPNKNSSENNQVSFKINQFLKSDGLKDRDFYFNSVCLDSRNRIWWGSNKSLAMLNLNKHKIAQSSPTVYLKQLDINEKFIDYRNITDSLGNEIDYNGVQQFENYPLNLELPYDKNHLTFHFVAIDWSAPHKIKYSYIMEGLNTSWSQPTTETKADYRNLPFGTYTFKVRAFGESGEWSEPHEYTFTIHPPWWHTWYARMGYAIAGVFLIFGFVRIRTNKLRKRQEELETEIANATQEIRKQKEEVETQKEVIEETHREITDSINYAERIQRSFLATQELLNSNLGEHFVYFNPKEAVSGDFYWAGMLDNGNFALSCADSTGHGVPGAIMSILNISSIEKAVEKGLTAPSDIFNETRRLIIERLKKDGSAEGGKDGMDASLIALNPEKTKMQYVAAHNPIWIIRNGELIEIKGEKMPVGKHDLDKTPFEGGEIDLQKGDVIYTMTDGFQDQFGGEKGKKFKVKPMKRMLLEMAELPMKEQQDKIAKIFDEWKGSLEQVDDVCIVGIRV